MTDVTRDNLRAHVLQLEGERHPALSPGPLEAAQEYVADQFRRSGLSVREEAFTVDGHAAANLIATTACPPGIPTLLIGAHLDTVPGTPGADDNASGVAAMLEAARVIAANDPHAPVTFAGFAMEEVGMLGSTHHVQVLKRQRTALIGMVSLEMVGFTESQGLQTYPTLLKPFYPPAGNFIGLVANWRSKRFLSVVERAMRAVEGLPVETVLAPMNGRMIPESRLSDHAPFWDAGYPAVLVTDTAFLRNPHYHQPSDTVSTLDLEFLAKVCRGIVTLVTAVERDATMASGWRPGRSLRP